MASRFSVTLRTRRPRTIHASVVPTSTLAAPTQSVERPKRQPKAPPPMITTLE